MRNNLLLLRRLSRDYNLRTEIVRVPTVREEDGLAKSSRNVNLSESERVEAPIIQQALKKGLMMFEEGMRLRKLNMKSPL